MDKSLLKKKCKACPPGTRALTKLQMAGLMPQVPGWKLKGSELIRTFKFKDYHGTIAFVGATAWISQREDHHPDMEVSYSEVKMRYSTHSVDGLSENDFICAAKVNEMWGL